MNELLAARSRKAAAKDARRDAADLYIELVHNDDATSDDLTEAFAECRRAHAELVDATAEVDRLTEAADRRRSRGRVRDLRPVPS